jgi:alkanesulfonate monooxygenase SsuD/methylene tetrahydromethanopterin reductase-like flavin-dependent oxidoreductase (luciferase family)
MKYAISIPPAGDPADLIACVQAAEEAGWDGFFFWDHIYPGDGFSLHDPWVLLGAAATATSRIRLGAMVTPLARRRPWKVAKEIATLDQLSAGRVVVGVGLGTPDTEFTAFGESADPRHRAAVLDEALALLDGFLRGEVVDHEGPHFQVRARLTPGCVQTPRPPIWVAATWPHRRPLARAARYEGVFALGRDAIGGLTPDQVREVRAVIGPDRDIVVPHDPEVPTAEYAEAGVTWLIVGPDDPDGDWLGRLRHNLKPGPPT